MTKIKTTNPEEEQQEQLIENQPVTIEEPIQNPILNTEQITQFSPYDNCFKNIYYYGTIGATDHEVEKTLQQVFTEVTGRSLQSWTCATCRKSNWYKLAKLYFDSINYIEKQNNIINEECLDSENQDTTV